MSPEAQRIAIAEACGWWVEPRDDGHDKWSVLISPDKERVESLSGVATLASFGCIPDYRNDLNAMHEAEKALTPGQWMEYPHALHAILHDECDSFEGYGQMFLRATAAQRAEAFLKTIGKWEVA